MIPLLFCLLPYAEPVTERCDLIEFNHYHDEVTAKPIFSQVIFYEWDTAENRYQVRAWRLLKHPSQLPQRRWAQRDYIACWRDGDTYRRMIAKTVRESWTQHDQEVKEREFLPKDKRRKLIKR